MNAACFSVEDQVVVGGKRHTGLARHLGNARGDVEVHGLDDDRVHALGQHVLGLRHLGLGVVLGRLHDHLVAGGFRRLREERHVGVQVTESGLLLQHERDLAGLPRHALFGRPGARGLPKSRGKSHSSGGAAD